VRNAFFFALLAAGVAGSAMAITLGVEHELGHGWWLVPASAGGGGAVGLVLGLLGHVLGRPTQRA
jgi:hypothetical protein